MQLSKTEHEVYETLKKNGFVVFRIRDVCLLMQLNKTKVYNIVKALKKKWAIKSLKGGLFTFKEANELEIGTAMHYPSYISFWSALNYYGWSDQTPHKIFIVTSKYTKDINSFKYVTLSKKRFFGYISVGNITIAEKEKAIIDSLIFPKYSGGMREIYGCLEAAYNELDKNKLIDYALKMDSRAVIRRLGYMLEKKGYKWTALLKKKIGGGYERLDPSLKRKNKLNKEWLLDINW